MGHSSQEWITGNVGEPSAPESWVFFEHKAFRERSRPLFGPPGSTPQETRADTPNRPTKWHRQDSEQHCYGPGKPRLPPAARDPTLTSIEGTSDPRSHQQGAEVKFALATHTTLSQHRDGSLSPSSDTASLQHEGHILCHIRWGCQSLDQTEAAGTLRKQEVRAGHRQTSVQKARALPQRESSCGSLSEGPLDLALARSSRH